MEKPITIEEEIEDMVATETATLEEAKMELIQSREETLMTTPTIRVATREEEEMMTTMTMMIMVIMITKLTTKEVVVMVLEAAITNVVAIEEVTKKTSDPEVEKDLVATLEIKTRVIGRETTKTNLDQSQLKLRMKKEFFTLTTFLTLPMSKALPKLSRNLELLKKFPLVTEEMVDHKVMPLCSSRPRMVPPKLSVTSMVRKLMVEPSR